MQIINIYVKKQKSLLSTCMNACSEISIYMCVLCLT